MNVSNKNFWLSIFGGIISGIFAGVLLGDIKFGVLIYFITYYGLLNLYNDRK